MSNLDQIVKGAPPPGKSYPQPSTTPISAVDTSSPASLADPIASLPSSPPQIYLNLLILEASLRAQWLQLRTRRRQHSFFLTLLGLWIIYFGYALFLAPREDGSGVGGSVYWVVEVTEKVCFMGGIVTGLLVWGTGQWERGVRWPRRWVWTTNRGLRGFNCKLVVIKQSWWREALSTLSFYFSYGLFSGKNRGSYRFVAPSVLAESEKARSGGHPALPNIHEDGAEGCEEDLAPGGDYVKLLLLPKPFSPTFRENWENYRTEYWEKENERRAILRKKFTELDRKAAKRDGGWLWWTGYRGWKRRKTADLEKTHPHVHRVSTLDKEHKRTRSGSLRSNSHSRNSSRSTTPTELEDPNLVRKASTASTQRKKKTAPAAVRASQKLAPARSTTPEVPSPLARENSMNSISSADTLGEADSARSLRKTPDRARRDSLRGAK